MERDQAKLKLEKTQKALAEKEKELLANVQNNKMLEWNVDQIGDEVKHANNQINVIQQTLD